MNVLVAVDAQLFKTPDGKVWAKTIYGYEFWKRYLDVFETVSIVSRMENVDYDFVKGFLRSDGENVTFKALPMAIGGKQYVLKLPSIIKAAMKAIKGESCAIIRLPSVSATFVEWLYSMTGKPYILEVVVDPVNAFEGNKLAASILTSHLKKACLRANGVSYVTQFALQEQYPSYAKLHKTDTKHFETYYSSIILKKDYFAEPRRFVYMGNKIRLVHTANNINNYVKGHDIAIKVVKNLRDKGVDASITFIGDGSKKEEFLQLAKVLGIFDYVKFTGVLPSSLDVRKVLLESDLFLFPTKCEGLPRAVIEAMAVGLPCLSTPVNGIPELLDDKYMFDPLDVDGFSNRVYELINNIDELNVMSMKNIVKAREYEECILQERRVAFYNNLKEMVK